MSTGAESRYSIAGRDQALDLTAHYPGHPEQGRHHQVGDDGFEARPHTAGFRSAVGRDCRALNRAGMGPAARETTQMDELRASGSMAASRSHRQAKR
jgi:hypothetical protein